MVEDLDKRANSARTEFGEALKILDDGTRHQFMVWAEIFIQAATDLERAKTLLGFLDCSSSQFQSGLEAKVQNSIDRLRR